MTIADIINKYNTDYLPYTGTGKLVNHLSMAQWAMYNVSGDIELVEEYSEKVFNSLKLNKVNFNYKKANTIDECLGNKELYQSCIDILDLEIEKYGLDFIVKKYLNKYDLGIVSDIYHPIIRLGYSLLLYKEDEKGIDEVKRSLAYYITSYKPCGVFKKRKENYQKSDILELINDNKILNNINKKETLEERLKELCFNEYFLEKGFVLGGEEDERIKFLLSFFSNIYIETNSIVILHCITGLHGLISLRDYYNDFSRAIDIYTTFALANLLAINIKDVRYIYKDSKLTWDYIYSYVLTSRNPHHIKLVYATRSLYSKYKIPELKLVAIKRLKSN